TGVGEWKRLLHVEREILGPLDPERRLRDVELRGRLIADDETTGELAGESPQHQRREVTVARAQLQERTPFDAPDPAEHAIVEHVALECAAMISGRSMPLLGDAVVVHAAGYRVFLP